MSRTTKPRTVNQTSIPAMLQTFQNEWDALMVETFTLKKQLDQCRTELATALFKQDAAERTIARLIRERDEAVAEARAGAGRRLGASSGGGMEDNNDVAPMEIEGGGLSSEQEKLLENTAAGLIQKRKSRVVPSTTASVKEVSRLHETAASPDQKAKLLSMDTSSQVEVNLLAVGGSTGFVSLFDTSTSKFGNGFQAHTKAVNCVKFAMGSNCLVTGSSDKTVKIWKSQGNSYNAAHTLTGLHSDSVVGLSVHPCGSLFASASRDQTWAFVDAQAGSTVFSISQPDIGSYSDIQFHPDGLLLATVGEDAEYHLRLWDVKSKENVVSFPGHKGRINSVVFSENGFYLATGSSDQTVKMWDLRNLASPIFANEKSDGEVMGVAFDHTGEYLAACGRDIQVYHVKTANNTITHSARLAGHKAAVNSVIWGKDAKSLYSISSDKTLRTWKI